MPNGLLSSYEAGQRLGCSVRTVHRLVTAGKLTPIHKLSGPSGAFLFDPADVEKLREQREAA